MRRLLPLVAAVLVAFPALATEAGWAALRNGGTVVFLNHARAPGMGDPASFDIDDCASQRSLSDQGRQQARRIGALIAARAAPVEEVRSSRYCRALETARLGFSDHEVIEDPDLEPVEPDTDAARAQQEAIYDLVTGYSGSGLLVLVTHEAVIRNVLGTDAREGEAVVAVPADGALDAGPRIVFN